MDLNKGQPGMGGNVVQAQNTNPRFGSKALALLNGFMGQASRKEFMDYQHSLNLERDTHREATKTAGNIIGKRADMEHWKEGIDYVRTDPNDPTGPKGPMPQSFRVGQVSHDTGSSYARDMQDLIKMKQEGISKLQKEKEEAKNSNPPKNTPGGKGGGKKKPKVSTPKERPGNLKDTTAAYKAGKIDVEQAADISPTFARNLGKKAAAEKIKSDASKPKQPKQTKKTPNKVKEPESSTPNNSTNRVIWGQEQPNMPKGGKARGPKPPKPPKPPKVGM